MMQVTKSFAREVMLEAHVDEVGCGAGGFQGTRPQPAR